jgi:serum/glucocorticoid-regulated kinase 2
MLRPAETGSTFTISGIFVSISRHRVLGGLLIEPSTPAPYIPPIDPSNASDTQNFDDTFLDMEPILDSELENNDATDSEREKSATSNGTDGEAHSGDAESSTQAPSSNVQSRSPSKPANDDVFDGYSFKGRHSVIIDDEEEVYEGTDEEDAGITGPKTEDTTYVENELDPGQKTPEAVHDQPPTPTAASAVAEAFRKKEAEAAAKAVDEKVVGATEERPTTPTHVKPASIPPASPEKQLPPPPMAEPSAPVVPAKEKVQTAPALPALPHKEKAPAAAPTPASAPAPAPTPAPAPASAPAPAPAPATVEKPRLDKPKPKIVEQLKAKARPRRERSGVAALDRGLSDVIDEDEEGNTEREDDDWDFVETPGAEDVNGVQGKSLFARGVVDRYRLAVFRKGPSSSNRSMPRADSTDYLESPASPSMSERKKTKGGGMSFGRKTFLRPKSPPATYSAGSSLGSRTALSHSHSATISASSTGLLTPSTSTAIPTMPISLKSRPSMTSVGSKPGSSDTSVNGDLSRLNLSQSAAELASPTKTNGSSGENGRRPPRMSVPEDDQRNRGLKKVRKYTTEGAEKVMSLFTSPKPPPSGTPQ